MGELADKLDDIEALLMRFERARSSGGEWRPLVHELFRSVHNVKSLLAMAGHEACAAVVHELESRLDGLRSGAMQPDASLVDALLEGLDAVRSLVHQEGDPEQILEALGRAHEKLRAAAAPVASGAAAPRSAPCLELSFSLAGEEMDLLRDSVAQGGRHYILEKLIDAALPQEAVAGLPIFETLREIGIPVAWRLEPAGSSGKLLTVLFSTKEPESELEYLVFDPYYPVSVPKVPAKTRLPRILIVDDDEIALLVLQHHLIGYGRVDTACRGDEALEKFRYALARDPYDVAFLDIMMPALDGHGVLREMRAAEDKAGILVGDGCRVIMASALADFSSVSESFKGLCDVYLVKPFERKAVEEVMRKLEFEPISVDPSRVPSGLA